MRRRLADVGVLVAFLLVVIIGLAQARPLAGEVPRIALAHVLGISGAAWILIRRPERLVRDAAVAAVILVALLLLVLFTGLGAEDHGARRRLCFAGLSLQPSELMKPAFVVAAAAVAVGERSACVRAVLGAACGLGLVLTLVQPDVATAALLLLVWLPLLPRLGSTSKLVSITAVLIVASLTAATASFPHVRARVHGYLVAEHRPLDEGYQIQRSYSALSAGGLFGAPEESRSARRFLPSAEHDFALATLVEERGALLGLSLLLAVGIALAGRAWVLNLETDPFTLYLTGLGLLLLYMQLALNATSVLGMVPIAGVPFPFLSLGGSSAVATWWLLALVHRGPYERARS